MDLLSIASRKKLRLLFFFIIALTSCALPPPPNSRLTSVPNLELQGATLGMEGLEFSRKGRLLEAEFKFRQALYLFPHADNLKINLAIVLERQGRYREAAQIFQKLIYKFPENLKYRVSFAQVFYRAGEYDYASKIFEHSLKHALAVEDIGPYKEQLERISRSLAVLSFTLGKEEEALCFSEFALNLRDRRDEFLRHARLLNALNFPEDSISVVERFNQTDSIKNDAELLHQLALAKTSLQQYEDGLDFEERALRVAKIDPALKFEMYIVQELAAKLIAASTEDDQQEITPERMLRQLLAEEDKQEQEEEEELYSVFEDSRIQDEYSIAHLALYWPAAFEQIFYQSLEEFLASQDEELVQGES